MSFTFYIEAADEVISQNNFISTRIFFKLYTIYTVFLNKYITKTGQIQSNRMKSFSI